MSKEDRCRAHTDDDPRNGTGFHPMTIALGVVLIAFGLLAWIGQAVSWIMPKRAADWSLTEHESAVDPVFYADIRGEAAWDSMSLWTLPVAGVLLLLGHSWWPYLGLVGGGTYLYFAGRGIAARRVMQRHGLRIGSERSVMTAYVFLTLWGIVALLAVVSAIGQLSS